MNALTVPEPASVAPPLSGVASDYDHFEIIDGRRVELPPMSVYANLVAFEIALRIGNHVRANDQGIAVMEMLFHLDLPVDRNRRPDAAFVSYARWAKGRPVVRRDNAWDVVPDLAIEVVSPTDLAEELVEKLAEYFRSGVRQVWVAYPNQRLLFVFDSLTSVRALGSSDELDGGAVLPGLRLSVAALFPGMEGA